jgi:hypothetical protein
MPRRSDSDPPCDNRVNLMGEEVTNSRLTVTLRGQGEPIPPKHASCRLVNFKDFELTCSTEVWKQALVFNRDGDVSHRGVQRARSQ